MNCRHRWNARKKYEGHTKVSVLTCVLCGKVIVQGYGAHEAVEARNPDWRAQRIELANKIREAL